MSSYSPDEKICRSVILLRLWGGIYNPCNLGYTAGDARPLLRATWGSWPWKTRLSWMVALLGQVTE